MDTAFRRFSRVLFRMLAYRPPSIDVPPQGAVLRDVTVVNPGKPRRSGQTLVVEGDRIASIAPKAPDRPESFEIADSPYGGAHVLPGLIDMHVHIPPPTRELIGLLFLAYGVTGIRETGDADGSTWLARERIRAGAVPGPRIFACGPVIDGKPPFLPTSWAVQDAGEAREAVATVAALGADFIKVQHKISVEALAAIRQAAEAKGLRVIGHIPTAVPFEEARIWDVQHLDGLVPYPQPPETPLDYQRKWRDLPSDRIDFYVKTSAEQGLVHTPTLVSALGLVNASDPRTLADPTLRLLPRYYRDGAWDTRSMPLFKRFSEEALATMKQAMARSQEVVRRLHEAGVPLHLGTDTAAMPFDVPGVSLQQELRLMVEAGLTPAEAWEAGTRVAGESTRVPKLGTVQEGAPADLLIFGGDPTGDLAALSTLKGVVAQGRLYSKEYLDAAIARHRERFERPIYDRPTTAFIRLMTRMMVPKG